MMKRAELIREYEDDVALDMYQKMTVYIEQHKEDIQRQHRDYRLLEVLYSVKASAKMPEGTKMELRGYEIIIYTPMKLRFRFGMGNFWIGGNLIVAEFREEIEDYMGFFINHVLPDGFALMQEKMSMIEKDLLKRTKLRNILEHNGSDLIQSKFIDLNLKHKLKFGNDGIVLKVYRKDKFLISGDLHYETLAEDLYVFMNSKLHPYINA